MRRASRLRFPGSYPTIVAVMKCKFMACLSKALTAHDSLLQCALVTATWWVLHSVSAAMCVGRCGN
eukprot:9559486-Lingulodinium_polyedra.AAC.1